MPEEPSEKRALLFISILQSLLKGSSVFYFLLLPILYATDVISAQQLGYIGALLIAGILVGAFIVSYALQTYRKTAILHASLCLLALSAVLLFWSASIPLLTIAFILVGLATGLGQSMINELAAQFTITGKRYKSLAKISMLGDLIRIVYPLIAGAIYGIAGFRGLIYFAFLTAIAFAVFFWLFRRTYAIDDEPVARTGASAGTASITGNRSFWFVISIEFVDSFASSQLFVFLPVLLIFKNFTVESALMMQSAVFVGYLCGRWLVGSLADRFSGYVAVGLAELGMVATLLLLLAAPASNMLYVLCFLLGIFARGTSPAIKALAFDSLGPEQMRRGSAIHVIGGDSGSAIGQFVFGLLLAWLGVTAPFVGAAVCAGIVAIACFSYRGLRLHPQGR